MSHTPGPWKQYPADTRGVLLAPGPLIAAEGRLLAVLHLDNDESHANARLITAAPDLWLLAGELAAIDTGCCYVDESEAGEPVRCIHRRPRALILQASVRT